MFDPIKKARIYEQITDLLIGKIRSHELKPGDRLPPERVMAVELGVSRTAIREALRSLETLGYIGSRVGGGTYVKRITLENVMLPFSAVLENDGRLIPDLMEVRLLLEAEMARLAALRSVPSDIESLEEAIRFQAQEFDEGKIGIEGDDRFHEALAEAAKNVALKSICYMCRDLLSKSRESALNSMADRRDTIRHHADILRAINAGDAALAAELMRYHIDQAYINVTKLKGGI